MLKLLTLHQRESPYDTNVNYITHRIFDKQQRNLYIISLPSRYLAGDNAETAVISPSATRLSFRQT